MGKNSGYSYQGDVTTVSRAKGTNMPVHFKNTVETANAIRGMKTKRAIAYLKNVMSFKECVPFKKFNGSVGRCAQAKAFKTTQGRWPAKSAKYLLELLNNAISNAEFDSKDTDTLYITHIQVNQATLHHRCTYRAHGRITPYMGHHCHMEIVLREKASK